MNVFISQPMNGKTNSEIKRARIAAMDHVEMLFPGEDVKFIDSFFEDAPHDAKPLWFLGASLQKMADADAVYFCRGWNNARGCKVEWEAAKAYGLKIIGWNTTKDDLESV